MLTPQPLKMLCAMTIAFGLLGLSPTAHAVWRFDNEECSPLIEHEVTALAPPAVMLMVDRSGSMDWRLDGSRTSNVAEKRWTIALDAIDTITKSMTQDQPNKLEFGLGWFTSGTASIELEAKSNANPEIMTILNGMWPSGGTPTAQAIKAMYKSNTVSNTGSIGPVYGLLGTYPKTVNTPIPDVTQSNCSSFLGVLSNCTYTTGNWVSSTIKINKSNAFDKLTISLSTPHSVGLHDLEIKLEHGGKTVWLKDWGGNSSAQGWNLRRVTDFAGHNMQGDWKISIRDRGYQTNWRGKIKDTSGTFKNWSLEFNEMLPVDTTNRATAGLLVTDGEPDHQVNAVLEACEHAKIAPMYVIGMGIPKGKEFNDIIAAAGGTGSCPNMPNVCTNTGNLQSYRGKCSGSYQANNAAALGTALSEISNAISCSYPLEVLGGGTVPPSNLGCEGYDCVYVSLDGGLTRIYHEETKTNGPVGWSWASTERRLIKLNSQYCGQIQSGHVRVVETQAACFCSQTPDDICNVFDPNLCECPIGRWACYNGLDVCEPSASCNGERVGEGLECDNSELGVCKEFGQTTCDGNGDLYCNAPAGTPQTEVCDGQDNDCDGIVDNVAWQGTAACHVDSGRNNAVIQQERTRCNVGHAYCIDGEEICEPLLPMPEICNGLDDDCDGLINNLAGSHERYNFEQRFSAVVEGDAPAPERPELSGDYATAACYERDVCNCPDGYTDISSSEYMSDNYEDFLETYWKTDGSGKPTCTCSSGLTD